MKNIANEILELIRKIENRQIIVRTNSGNTIVVDGITLQVENEDGVKVPIEEQIFGIFDLEEFGE